MRDRNDQDERLKYRITPKGFLAAVISEKFGVPLDDGIDVYHRLEGFCCRGLRITDPDAEFAALIFDGVGGEIIGVDCLGTIEDEDD